MPVYVNRYLRKNPNTKSGWECFLFTEHKSYQAARADRVARGIPYDVEDGRATVKYSPNSQMYTVRILK